jgi:hypothetical protein
LRRIAGLTVAVALVASACQDPSAPRPALVARAEVEVLNLFSSNPDPGAHATCQTGAAVKLAAFGSYDPAGESLTYEWLDLVDGIPTEDFRPAGNPLRWPDADVHVLLATIGLHEITLTVRSSDGRRASTKLLVRVTSCEEC